MITPLTDTNLQLIHNVTDRQPITARGGRYTYSLLNGTINGTAALIYCCAFNCCFHSVFLCYVTMSLVSFSSGELQLFLKSYLTCQCTRLSLHSHICCVICTCRYTNQKWVPKHAVLVVSLTLNTFLDTFVLILHFLFAFFVSCQNTFSNFSNFPPSSFYETREFSCVACKPSLKFSKCSVLKVWLQLLHWCWNSLNSMYYFSIVLFLSYKM